MLLHVLDGGMPLESLDRGQQELAREVLRRVRPHTNPDEVVTVLNPGAVDLLIEAAGDELAERGLGVGDEPTEYGVQLESLIDALLRIKLNSE